MNGTRNATAARPKRKAAGSPNQAPPAKRATNGKVSEEDGSDVEFVDYDDEADLEHDLQAQAAMYIGTPSSLGEWSDTIQKVVRNVVAIRFCQTCSFDTDSALTSEATGFVVDSEKG
jgi:hypothetical protein